MVIVFFVAAVVNALLLEATGLLLTERPSLLALLVGSMGWGILTAMSVFPATDVFRSQWLRICCLVLVALLTFGLRFSSMRAVLIFLVLHLAVHGLSQSDRLQTFVLCLLSIAGICVLQKKEDILIPVELSYRGKTISLTALRDTGNTLYDPVTGARVLIVGADIASMLIGLTQAELKDPVAAIGSVPGLRLIPYKTIGNTGFLLAMKIADAKIGTRQGSTIVAFSPLVLDSNYQALTGGTV